MSFSKIAKRRHVQVARMTGAEDDDELHRRLDSILTAEGRNYKDAASLTLRSLAGEDALLAADGPLSLMQTALLEELDTRAADKDPALIVIDTLADVFPANENDRSKARQVPPYKRGHSIGGGCMKLDGKTSNRESADHYHTVIENTESHRVILCRDGLQWIIQFRSGRTVAGPRWRSISYCTTREALKGLWPHLTGKALQADLAETIGGGHG